MEQRVSTDTATLDRPAAHKAIPAWMTFLLAGACGLIVANLYYAQPLVGPISAAIGLSPKAAGLIVTMTQLGYVLGLLLIVPLGDLVENRRLVLAVSGLGVLALIATGFATEPAMFLGAALLIGIGSVAVQILVPYAAHLAPDAIRGRVVGNVMSGLLLGIMLARPIASLVTQVTSWRTIFFVSAGAMVALGAVLARALPERRPAAGFHYGVLLASMGRLLLATPVLRRRAFYKAALFGAFSLFWTTAPLLLEGPAFHLSQAGIAVFALVGVSGAISAPLAGRAADRGWSRPATAAAMLLVATAFLMTRIAPLGSTASLILLAAAGIVLDFGVQANTVLGQRAIFMLNPAERGRLNGLYIAIFFVGGAVGSAAGAWAYAQGGWALASAVGLGMPALAFAYFLTERR